VRGIFYSLNLTTTALPAGAGQALAISDAQDGTELAIELSPWLNIGALENGLI
jgi:hypothetical protein